jgi:hypothetical protein
MLVGSPRSLGWLGGATLSGGQDEASQKDPESLAFFSIPFLPFFLIPRGQRDQGDPTPPTSRHAIQREKSTSGKVTALVRRQATYTGKETTRKHKESDEPACVEEE